MPNCASPTAWAGSAAKTSVGPLCSEQPPALIVMDARPVRILNGTVCAPWSRA